MEKNTPQKDIFDLTEQEFEQKFNNEILPKLKSSLHISKDSTSLPALNLILILVGGFSLSTFVPIIGVPFLLLAIAIWAFKFDNKQRNSFVIRDFIFNSLNIKFYDKDSERSLIIEKFRPIINKIFLSRNFKADDILSFNYKGLPVRIMELCISFSNPTENYFFLTTKINKKFTKETSVCSRFPIRDKGVSGKKVLLEDPDFNKKFKVYSHDQVEARYLLTPSFMERLKNYKQKHSSGISVFFDNTLIEEGNIYICASLYLNLFEIIGRNPLHFQTYYSVIQQIKGVLDIVDSLKLDQDIGM